MREDSTSQPPSIHPSIHPSTHHPSVVHPSKIFHLSYPPAKGAKDMLRYGDLVSSHALTMLINFTPKEHTDTVSCDQHKMILKAELTGLGQGPLRWCAMCGVPMHGAKQQLNLWQLWCIMSHHDVIMCIVSYCLGEEGIQHRRWEKTAQPSARISAISQLSKLTWCGTKIIEHSGPPDILSS